MTPGRETSEWVKSLRAEALGAALVVFGSVMSVLRDTSWPTVLVAAGVYLVGHSASSYSHGRASIKAAALRPRVQNAPPSV
jgi:hypothetical protein